VHSGTRALGAVTCVAGAGDIQDNPMSPQLQTPGRWRRRRPSHPIDTMSQNRSCGSPCGSPSVTPQPVEQMSVRALLAPHGIRVCDMTIVVEHDSVSAKRALAGPQDPNSKTLHVGLLDDLIGKAHANDKIAFLISVWLEGEKGVHEARTGDWVASTCNVVHLTDARERANVGLAPRAHRGPTYTHRTGSIASHLTADIIVRCDGTEQCVH
jgi:hypothetical protein